MAPCPCLFPGRATYSSLLWQTIVSIKLLHGTPAGAKGSTTDEIAMFMVKFFCLEGDVKSMIESALRFAVKRNYMRKKKDRYSVIVPIASLFKVPTKCQSQELNRSRCLFPVAWHRPCKNTESPCGAVCCGDRVEHYERESSTDSSDAGGMCTSKQRRCRAPRRGTTGGGGGCERCNREKREDKSGCGGCSRGKKRRRKDHCASCSSPQKRSNCKSRESTGECNSKCGGCPRCG